MILLDLLYPPRCAICHCFVKNGRIRICEACERRMPYTSDFGRMKVEFLRDCVASLYYENDVRESLLRYKFGGCTGYAKAYAPLLASCIRQTVIDEIDLLSWIPVSRKRLRERGYDQAELLAKAVGKELNLRPLPTLKKIRDTKPQSGTGSAEKRRANIAGAYRVIDPEQIANRRILLIDDILTTGATVRECAKTLGLAGAESVCCAAVARKRD